MDEMINLQCSGSCETFCNALNTGKDNAENYIKCFRELLEPYGITIEWDSAKKTYYYSPQGKLTTVFTMTWEWDDTKETIIIQEVRG